MSDTFKPVKLRSPDGQEFTAHDPTTLNNALYSWGYTPVGRGKSIEDVLPSSDGGAESTAKQPGKDTAK